MSFLNELPVLAAGNKQRYDDERIRYGDEGIAL